MKNWFDYIALPNSGSYLAFNGQVYRNALLQWALSRRLTFQERILEGGEALKVKWVAQDGIAALIEILTEKGAFLFAETGWPTYKEHTQMWAWDSGYLVLVFPVQEKGEEKRPPDIHFLDAAPPAAGRTKSPFVLAFDQWFKQHLAFVQEEDSGPGNDVYALTLNQQNNLRLSNIGWVNAPLQSQNYAPEVVKGFDFICAELNRMEPHGRITILDGPPGTGKTWFIRALIHHNPECKFIVIPPDMITELGKPNMLPLFLDYRDDYEPLVLILEDADQMLASRMAENMATITAALNMGDGILGSTLNIKMVCSTNQPLANIDPALRRPGRLSSHLRIDALPYSQAFRLLSLLVHKDETKEVELPPDTLRVKGKSATLAEIFDTAKTIQDNQEAQNGGIAAKTSQ